MSRVAHHTLLVGVLLVSSLLVADAEAQTSPASSRGGAVAMCQGLEATLSGSGLLIGSSGADVIVGSPGPDRIVGRGGADTICARGGADVIRAGRGDDRVYGGGAIDTIAGGPGDDLLYGGRGWDSCRVSSGDDLRVRCEVTIRAVPNGPLAGVAIGDDAENAATEFARVIGPPRADSGWVVGCPLDGPEVNERTLTWGSLVVSLSRNGSNEAVHSWHYRLDPTGQPDAGGPPISQVRLPGGVTFGTPIGEVADALGEPLLEEFFGRYIDLDGLLLYSNVGGGGATNADPLDGVGVPFIPACD